MYATAISKDIESVLIRKESETSIKFLFSIHNDDDVDSFGLQLHSMVTNYIQ